MRTHLGADSDLLTASEVGERLRLPLSTVYYLAKEGKLRGFRVGRSWRFPLSEIHNVEAAEMPLVLVVDDHEPTRKLVARVLEPCGCRVEQAGTAQEALRMARKTRFDVLFIDLKLPDREGTDLIRELKGTYKLAQMVLISALPALSKCVSLDGIGGIGLLPKPLSEDGLTSCVEQITGHRLRNGVRVA